jgi:YVTN family beta-propeller protein
MGRGGALARRGGRVIAALTVAGLSLGVPHAGAATVRPAVPGTVFVTSLDRDAIIAISPTHRMSVITGNETNLAGPLGIAITPNGRLALVTDSRGDAVTPVHLSAGRAWLGKPVRVGRSPAAVAITSDGTRAYVTNFDSNTVTPLRIAGANVTALAPIKVGPGPWSVAVTPSGSMVVVSNTESASVSVINVARHHVTTVAVGDRPQAVVVAPNGKTAYVAAGSAVVPIALGATPRSLAPIAVAGGPLGIAITPDGKHAYTANADQTVTPISFAAHPPRALAAVAVGSLSQPDGVAISPDGKVAYAANASNVVTPIRLTAPPRAMASFNVGGPTFGIAVAPDQAPVARLTVTPGPVGKATTLDASKSTSSDGGFSSFSWSFGDGQHARTTTSVVRHVYHRAGHFTASVTVTSRYGTSTSTTYTGQTASNHGGRSAQATTVFAVAATLQTYPPKGPPALSVRLVDPSVPGACPMYYIYFDNHLVGESPAFHHSLDVANLVIPGDAKLGAHVIELSCSLGGKLFSPSTFTVVDSANHLSEFSVAMPSLKTLSHHLVEGGSVSLVMLLMTHLISIGFPSAWLDATYEQNRERFHTWGRKNLPTFFRDRTRQRSMRRRVAGGTGMFFGFIFLAGLISSVLDPGFGFNRTTLWLFLGLCAGIALVTLASQLPVALGGLRQKRTVHLHVVMGGIVIAVVCVAASRALGLSPGYCYGLIAGFAIVPKVSEREWGKFNAYSSIAVLATATAAFFLRGPVFDAATKVNPSPWLLVLTPALDVAFVFGFTSLAFGMFPLPFLPGRHMAKWNRVGWFAITFLSLAGFVAVLLSPGSGSSNEVHHVALLPLIAAFVAFALLSLGLMLYFHRHPHEPHGEGEHEGGLESHEAAEPASPAEGEGPELGPTGAPA